MISARWSCNVVYLYFETNLDISCCAARRNDGPERNRGFYFVGYGATNTTHWALSCDLAVSPRHVGMGGERRKSWPRVDGNC